MSIWPSAQLLAISAAAALIRRMASCSRRTASTLRPSSSCWRRGVVVRLRLRERGGGPRLDLALAQRRVQHHRGPVEQRPHILQGPRRALEVVVEAPSLP
jgi:hypothetical protein